MARKAAVEEPHTIEPTADAPERAAEVMTVTIGKELPADEVENEALIKRVEDLEKVVALLLTSLPKWIGYVDSESRFIDSWYDDMRKAQHLISKGVRD